MGSSTPEDDRPDLGRAVIEDLVRAAFPAYADASRQPDPAETTPSPEDGESDVQGTAGVADSATPVPRPRTPTPALVPPPAPLVIDLGVERATRRVTGFLLVATLVVTVLAAAVAYGDPRPVTVGLVLFLVAALLATWWFRSRHRTATVIATGSRLEIVRDGGLHVFDLSRRDSPVDVIGRPGDRTWRVLFHRRGMGPYVVDASMVDPAEFMRLLHAHRSEVHYRPH
jgi:hypothetical protein